MKGTFIIIILLFLLLFFFLLLLYTDVFKEGFQVYNNVPWSPDLIARFQTYQATVNDGVRTFNLEELQRQASPEEAESYLTTGYWPWTDDVKRIYLEKVAESPTIKILPSFALNDAMKTYNLHAVQELLDWNTDEGKFLLHGATIYPSSPDAPPYLVQCSADNTPSQLTIQTSPHQPPQPLEPRDIPSHVPGFQFTHPDKPCNPCSIFHDGTTAPCPFKLQ